MSYNRLRTLELIKKSLYDNNVGKIKEHKRKSNANIINGYIRKFNYVHDFGHPSSGGPLIKHDIVREMKM
jgi:hypothetical protein